MKQQKVFPIKTATACQLKWTHSTVFLTTLKTASCHRVSQDSFDLNTFDFHNTEEKLIARQKMLEGQWPGNGCEHCKNIEDSGGTSDRILHLDFPGISAPPELDDNLAAVKVTPRILEIYFSNTCNLKCVYCTPMFSSKINQENKKWGTFLDRGVQLVSYNIPEEFNEATDKMFDWLDQNIHMLDKLIILGGEPMIQKETQRLLDFLEGRDLPNLSLVMFSNLTIEPEKFKNQIDRLNRISVTSNLNQINIIGSLDCWGEQAEYVRNGLNLEWFETNFEYMLHNTNFVLNINSALDSLTVNTMPKLVEKINEWNKVRTVYWSMMKTGGRDFLHPTIFGSKLMDMGFQKVLDLFAEDLQDIDKLKYLEYFKGIGEEIKSSTPSAQKQKKLKIYLEELDRRRNTDYKKTFPVLASMLADIET